MKFKYYLRSIDRRWKKELEKASGRVLVFSPYLTSSTAESVLKNVKNESCEIYTRFSLEDFAAGSSSLKTLKHLAVRGFKLYKIPKLHAKMIIVPGVFASIGSQNLTVNGRRNREASVVIEDLKEVVKIEKMAEDWLSERYPITYEMITDLEDLLPPLQRKFKDLKDESAKEERKHRINRIKSHLDRLGTEEGEVPIDVAKKFIRASAWWYDHPSGPVSAPGHSSRIYGSESDWKIDFGANTFMVGRAISRCRKTLSLFLEQASSGNIVSISKLKEKLTLDVRGAVTNYDGDEYPGYYPVVGADMKFGAQSIDTKDFVNLVLKIVPVDDLYD